MCRGERDAGEVRTESEGEEGGKVIWDYGVKDGGEDEWLRDY